MHLSPSSYASGKPFKNDEKCFVFHVKSSVPSSFYFMMKSLFLLDIFTFLY